jgi:hypothetical protein
MQIMMEISFSYLTVENLLQIKSLQIYDTPFNSMSKTSVELGGITGGDPLLP